MSHSQSSAIPYLLISTVRSVSEGKRIARYLVSHKLSACVNVVPGVYSVFRWKGKVDQAKELLLLIKTRRSRLKKIEEAICRLHSYSIPEIIAFPIRWAHKPYFNWLLKSIA